MFCVALLFFTSYNDNSSLQPVHLDSWMWNVSIDQQLNYAGNPSIVQQRNTNTNYVLYIRVLVLIFLLIKVCMFIQHKLGYTQLQNRVKKL